MGIGKRDLAIVLALLAAIVGVLVLAEDSASADSSAAPASAALPRGWHPLRRPIDGVLYPTQVLAAASFPARVPRHPRGCHPGAVLRQMPAAGVLIKVFEYARRNRDGRRMRVPHLPPRPARFRFPSADYAPFECAGLSHRFAFEQDGRAFQAHVWFDPTTVAPELRAQALLILDAFAPPGAATASGR